MTPATLPSHGFVRNKLWELSAINIIDGDTTQLIFQLMLDDTTDSLWPYAGELTYTVTIGSTLSLQLCINNKSDETVSFCKRAA